MNAASESLVLNFGLGPRWRSAPRPNGRVLKEARRRVSTVSAKGSPPARLGRSDWNYLSAARFFPGEFQPVCHSGQIGQRSRLHLSHDVAPVDFHRDFADPDLVGDLLVEAAG